jgi:hypothetical protein
MSRDCVAEWDRPEVLLAPSVWDDGYNDSERRNMSRLPESTQHCALSPTRTMKNWSSYKIMSPNALSFL